MTRLMLIIMICVGVALAGCRREPEWHTLSLAEAMMEEQPDSALALLQPIDGSRLKGEAQARHALLLSQAYDKNYVDLADDSLISIALNYYDRSTNPHYKMMAKYYWACIHYQHGDYDGALSMAFEAEKLAESLNDVAFLSKLKYVIAMSYLYSNNIDAAESYLKQDLALLKSSNKVEWMGQTYYKLAELSLDKHNFSQALEYLDTAKSLVGSGMDFAQVEMLSLIGLDRYAEADSIYLAYLADANPHPQLQAYHLLAAVNTHKISNVDEELSELLKNADRQDSIDLAAVGKAISLSNGDYKQALFYGDILQKESDRVIVSLSQHSRYQIQLEHEKAAFQLAQSKMRNREQLVAFCVILLILTAIVAIVYIRFLKSRNKMKLIEKQNEMLLLLAEYTQLKEQIESTHDDVRAQLVGRFEWIEEIGHLYLDSALSKTNPDKPLRIMSQRLQNVRSKEFVDELIATINQHDGNILARVEQQCPKLSSNELTLLAMLYINLSPRICAFILDMRQQSIYNSKSSIKRKLLASCPDLLAQLSAIFPA